MIWLALGRYRIISFPERDRGKEQVIKKNLIWQRIEKGVSILSFSFVILNSNNICTSYIPLLDCKCFVTMN